jgi:Recombinase
MQRRKKKFPPKLLAVQNAFLKRLIWKRYRNRIPENDLTKIVLDQFCLRLKIDARVQGLSPEHAIVRARDYLAKRAPWFDVEAFQWKSPDKIKLLGAVAFGEAISLTERECFLCRPAPFTPIDKGKDKEVQKWIREAQDKSAKKRSKKLKAKRAGARKELEADVRRLLKEGSSYRDIAQQFNNERREPHTSPVMNDWTPRKVFAFDPDRKSPEQKRIYQAELKRMARNPITELKRNADRIEKAQSLIRELHFQGAGYGTIARYLNEHKIKSQKGGKWHRNAVKREVERVHEVYTKCPRSPSVYTGMRIGIENDCKVVPEIAAETQQEGNIQREDTDQGKVATKDKCLAMEWSTPVMVEMAYTDVLRKLYQEKVAEAA